MCTRKAFVAQGFPDTNDLYKATLTSDYQVLYQKYKTLPNDQTSDSPLIISGHD